MKFLVDKVKGVDLNLKADWGETAFDHVNGRKGLEEIQAYLKMKVAANAVQAAIRFKSMAKFKKKGGGEGGEAAAAPAAEAAA